MSAQPSVQVPEPSLRAVVRAVLAASDALDPHTLAVEVDALLSDRQRRAAFPGLLRGYVADVIRAERNARPGAAPEAPPRPYVPSAKVAGIASWWAARLADRYSVAGVWMRLGDMTRADLLAAAAERRAHAAATVAVAERLERVAAIIPDEATVGETPEAARAWNA
jgi:hypothetical protein